MRPQNGRHLSFPFRVNNDGRTATVASLEEHVRDELVQLLLTNPAERLFVPELGGGVRRLVFENADETTAAMSKAIITQSVSRYLGHRVALEELTVQVTDSLIEIELKYRIAGTEDSRILKFQRQGG
ncbi:MAG: GPW/gp25 family protein [Acidobacteria bacterium]|nr:GPW/gp25 family protein [Acidobacteriota bacterium]